MLKDPVYIDAQEYGICRQSAKGGTTYIPLGRAPWLEDVLESIEDDHITLKVAASSFQRDKIAYLDLGDLYDGKNIRELASLGFDVTKGKAEVFLKHCAFWSMPKKTLVLFLLKPTKH